MVIPWAGYSLSEFIKQCEPLSSAQVRAVSLRSDDPNREPWTSEPQSDWPYSEGCGWMRPCIR